MEVVGRGNKLINDAQVQTCSEIEIAAMTTHQIACLFALLHRGASDNYFRQTLKAITTCCLLTGASTYTSQFWFHLNIYIIPYKHLFVTMFSDMKYSANFLYSLLYSSVKKWNFSLIAFTMEPMHTSYSKENTCLFRPLEDF